MKLRFRLRPAALAVALGSWLSVFAVPAAAADPDYRPLDRESQALQNDVLAIGAEVYASLGAPPAGQADDFDALVRLIAGQREGGAGTEGEDIQLKRALLEAEYGLPEDAARLLGALPERGAWDRLRLALAKAWIDRGELDRAWRMLAQTGGAAGSDEQAERALLQARILMTRGRDPEAAATLDGIQSPPEWAAYARFNRAVALSRANQNEAAAAALETLGKTESVDQEVLALRDKANIALGFLRLARQQPGPAGDAFNRVRFDSPLSVQALYGLGWAEFEQGNFPRALIPWNELQQRRVADPAVQAVWLMIPYAQWRLGAYRDAVQRYREAVDAFDRDLQQSDALSADVRGGTLLNALSAGGAGESAAVPPPLLETVADARFALALDAYHHLSDQQRRLEDWSRRLAVRGSRPDLQARIAAVQPRLADALSAHRAFLDELALAGLERERQRTERFQLRAREELARLLDDIAIGAERR
jgi:tetratricopeptide (TPR) repeat protein